MLFVAAIVIPNVIEWMSETKRTESDAAKMAKTQEMGRNALFNEASKVLQLKRRNIPIKCTGILKINFN